MKKLFTLVAMAFMAVCVNAQVLVAYPTQADVTGTWEVSGTTTEATVKINTNTESVAGLKLANGYSNSGKSNGNHIKLSYEGGFKKGDVITIAGVTSIKETDVATKSASVVLFSMDVDSKCTAINTFENFINGRLTNDEIIDQTYTLEDDYETLYIGRQGNTAAYVTKILVTRPAITDGINTVKDSSSSDSKSYNVGGRVASKGLLIKNGKKYVK